FAPDRYATVRDIYVKHRDAKMALTGRYNANWDAIPELLATTRLSLPALNQQLIGLSVHLFLHHPVRYAVGVTRAWIDFWMVPHYWTPEHLSPRWLASVVTGVWRVEHPLIRLMNVAFIMLTAAAVVSSRFRARVRYDFTLAAISTVVLSSSLVQALGEYGENARYAVPVQSLVIV